MHASRRLHDVTGWLLSSVSDAGGHPARLAVAVPGAGGPLRLASAAAARGMQTALLPAAAPAKPFPHSCFAGPSGFSPANTNAAEHVTTTPEAQGANNGVAQGTLGSAGNSKPHAPGGSGRSSGSSSRGALFLNRKGALHRALLGGRGAVLAAFSLPVAPKAFQRVPPACGVEAEPADVKDSPTAVGFSPEEAGEQAGLAGEEEGATAAGVRASASTAAGRARAVADAQAAAVEAASGPTPQALRAGATAVAGAQEESWEAG